MGDELTTSIRAALMEQYCHEGNYPRVNVGYDAHLWYVDDLTICYALFDSVRDVNEVWPIERVMKMYDVLIEQSILSYGVDVVNRLIESLEGKKNRIGDRGC